MRIESPLADIDFTIGSMKRQGNTLVFKSGEPSSLDSTVHMTPADAGTMLRAFFKSPSAIGFALSLPFLWIFAANKTRADHPGDKTLHPFDHMNKPW